MNSRKLTNFLLVALLVILVGFLTYYLFVMRDHSWGDTSNEASSTTQTATSTAATSSSTPTIPPPQISSVTITDHNTSENYALDASYPKLSAMDNVSAQASINANIYSLVEGEVSAFKDSLPDDSEPDTGSSSDDTSDQSTFQLSYTKNNPTSFSNIQGFVLNESFYTSGAAHTGDSVFALNYNLVDGSLISLDDLFAPGSNYLSVISDYAKNDLTKQLSAGNNAPDADTINQGAAPTEDNYKQFLITNSGLEIIFNEYQVASYAAGELKVIVPWSVLQTLLNPSGPVKI